MVTYGGMSKKPVTVSTSSFIFKVSQFDFCGFYFLEESILHIETSNFYLSAENCELVWVR